MITDAQVRLARVSDPVDGFESAFGLELLATVHWIAANDAHAPDLDEIVRHTYRWNESKKQFSRRQIETAFHVLSEKGWVAPASHSRPAHV